MLFFKEERKKESMSGWNESKKSANFSCTLDIFATLNGNMKQQLHYSKQRNCFDTLFLLLRIMTYRVVCQITIFAAFLNMTQPSHIEYYLELRNFCL